MNLSAAEIDILFDAVEDYAPLWDAKWECGRQKCGVAEAELIHQGQAAIAKLIELSLISLQWDSLQDTPVEIVPEQTLELLQQAKYWSPSEVEGSLTICFSATDKGKETFRTNEQIKAYYRSEEFAFRYPAPEWHSMKRS